MVVQHNDFEIIPWKPSLANENKYRLFARVFGERN